MTDDYVPWHYLRKNDASRYPRRIICFDSEAKIAKNAKGERHTFRCAVASFDLIDKETHEPTKSEMEDFASPEELWAWVCGKAARRERTIVYAHNLGYDLRICQAFTILPNRGWSLDFLTMDTMRCVSRWSLGDRRLTFCDTSSWLPTSLERIATLLGMRKASLPTQNADAERWLHRCRTDVEITRAAMLHVNRYLEEADLGSWRMTGPAQAMASFRHRFLTTKSLLVHRDEDALKAERRAAWSGRCEVRRHGAVKGPIQEWDFELAYLNLAHTLGLPVRLYATRAKMSIAQLRQYSHRCCVLADVTVNTEHETVPTLVDNRTAWPIGSFRTTLWDIEILAACERGATIAVERAWLYRKHPVLREWAAWLLGELGKPDGTRDELIALMHKNWARSLVGRFGLRYPQWSQAAILPYSEVEYVPFYDIDTGEEGAYLQAGNQLLERSGLSESANSMPAIMGYIMAGARLRLLEAIEAAGENNVLYLDTDALLVNGEGGDNLAAWSDTEAGAGLRLKSSYASANFRAPRAVKIGGEVRVAGMPKGAIPSGKDKYDVTIWEGMSQSLRMRRPGEVRLRNRSFELKAPDRRRVHLANGATAPLTLSL